MSDCHPDGYVTDRTKAPYIDHLDLYKSAIDNKNYMIGTTGHTNNHHVGGYQKEYGHYPMVFRIRLNDAGNL